MGPMAHQLRLLLVQGHTISREGFRGAESVNRGGVGGADGTPADHVADLSNEGGEPRLAHATTCKGLVTHALRCLNKEYLPL